MERTQAHNWVARLRRFVAPKTIEHCDFCAKPIAPSHSHVIERATRRFMCACRECDLLLGHSDRYSQVPNRAEALDHFQLSDAEWDNFRIPIGLVFVFRSTASQGPVAIYPGPAGPVESHLGAQAWERLVIANPSLAEFEPDVEALLVNRTKGAREYYRVSIDRCYALIGLIRTRWRGLSGGSEAGDAVSEFFGRLRDGHGAGELVHG
jgi:Family of unknown function (DUF5947)